MPIRLRAAGIIVKNNKILLMHRRKDSREYWVIPGGEVEEGETPEQALIREIKEELGLTATHSEKSFETDDQISHTVFFICQVEDKDPILGGPESLRLSPDNWYNPEWVMLDKVKDIELLPEDAKRFLLSL